MNPNTSAVTASESGVLELPSHTDERNLATILDNLDALVYVADIETHKMLYLNAYGRARWGDFADKYCWEVLQSGQSGPCEFCTNAELVDEQGDPLGVHVWEFQNTTDGRWYQCRDQAIRWNDGRVVRLEIATDITDRKNMEQQLAAATERAETLAYTDMLTGVANRRAFFERGEQQFERNRVMERSMAVVIFDIDHFKQINDTYGHHAGDDMLRAVANAVQPLLREGDLFARLGGEEFAAVIATDEAQHAMAVAERLREAIAAVALQEHGRTICCTASFGVAFCNASRLPLDDVLAAADRALFQAKRGGRNRVVYAA